MITENIKIFAASLFLGTLFWLGMNAISKVFADMFFWNEVAGNPQLYGAQVLQAPLHLQIKPIKKSEASNFAINAKAALSVFVSEKGKAKILFQKDADTPFPIASIAKLMTGLVAIKQYSLDQKITITKEAVQKEEDIGNLRVGEVLSVNSLLHSMLIESSNDAAEALSGALGDSQFIRLMNAEAKEVGLEETFFADSSGVDPNNQGDPINVSSARDLFLFAKYIMENHPKIFDILSLPRYTIYTPEGKVHHVASNTDELLYNPELKVLGGKTGWTPRSQGCLLLLVESPAKNGYIVNVLLGSENRFEDMKKLVNWAVQSYDF